jgi:hypothetical protein
VILLSRLAEHSAGHRLHELVLVLGEDLGEREGVVELAPADEVKGGEHRYPPLPPIVRAREPEQDISVLVGQVSADDVVGADVDEVPGVDAVGPPQVQLVELVLSGRGGARSRRLLSHHADRADPRLVGGLLEELLDLLGGHLDIPCSERDDLAHPNAPTLGTLGLEFGDEGGSARLLWAFLFGHREHLGPDGPEDIAGAPGYRSTGGRVSAP